MSNGAEELRAALERDVQKYCNNIARHMVSKIADDMTDTARSAISQFYSSYKPKYYFRNWNFRYSYKRYYKNHGNRFSGGVELLRGEIPQDYTMDSSHVFDFVYAGLHGLASTQGRAPIMAPSPMEIINRRYDYILTHQSEYEKYGEQMARNDTYEFLKF